MDVLIGNPDIGLQPVYNLGIRCPNGSEGNCLYRSRFESGYVPLGSFGKENIMINSVKHVLLNKMFPPSQGLFFKGESLGVPLVKQFIHCNSGWWSEESAAVKQPY